MWRVGWRLAVESGLRMDHVMWDADEVLWDWVMTTGDIARRGFGPLWRREMTHTEYIRWRPGVLALLTGLQAGNREVGTDPWLRVWTNGYAWRIAQIARGTPAFAALLGPPHALPAADDVAGWEALPNLFCRTHYIALAHEVLDAGLASNHPALRLSGDEGRVIARELRRRPQDSTLKIPGLAALVGKDGFTAVRVLVDDSPTNCTRFAATGRVAVQVQNPPPHGVGRWIPNLTTASVTRWLALHQTTQVTAMAEALGACGSLAPGSVLRAGHARRAVASQVDLVLEVPHAQLMASWYRPTQGLRRRVRELLRG